MARTTSLLTVCIALPSALAFAPLLLPQRPPVVSATRAAALARVAQPHMNADDHWDLERLRSSIAANSNARFGTADTLLDNSQEAFVLLFNPGLQDEGVYTLQCRSDPRTYMVAFECSDEAVRFAHLLQAEGFDMASPTAWPAPQLKSFCAAAGFELSYVPQGALFTPPTNNGYDAKAFEQLAELGAIEREPVTEHFSDPATDLLRQKLERIFDMDNL